MMARRENRNSRSSNPRDCCAAPAQSGVSRSHNGAKFPGLSRLHWAKSSLDTQGTSTLRRPNCAHCSLDRSCWSPYSLLCAYPPEVRRRQSLMLWGETMPLNRSSAAPVHSIELVLFWSEKRLSISSTCGMETTLNHPFGWLSPYRGWASHQ